MPVKLSSLKANVAREEKGDWIEYPDWPGVAFNVSSLHSGPYVMARDIMLQRLARKHGNDPVPVEVRAMESGKIYCGHILHGWRGLDVEYTPEVALDTLCDPAFRVVTEAVEWCAGRVGQIAAEFIDLTTKNSEAPSAIS